VDTAAGISESVITFSRAADEVIVVLCDEPASLTDAYALIKLLSREYGVERFHVLANRIARLPTGPELCDKLRKITGRFLDVTLNCLGMVPEDPQLGKAVRVQQAVMEAFPSSPSALAFHRVAAEIERWPRRGASGTLQFFLERLVQGDAYDEGLV
jgi:flagellar biosynthesis protein FlhG